MKTKAAALAAALLATAGAPATTSALGSRGHPDPVVRSHPVEEQVATSPTAADAERAQGWRSIEGSWSASGKRQGIATESGQAARILYLSGAVVLTASEGVSRGFRGELIAFDDGGATSVGRLVWTDEHGARVFGTFKGAGLRPGNELTVTLTGGTGRYAGIAGELALTWQYVVDAEDEAIQVRTTRLTGRYRLAGGRP